MADNSTRDDVLSPVSSADSKTSKSVKDNRVFERLSVSIQYFVESLGYDTHYRKLSTIISSDALCALTEDVNYRLRELANNASLFMRQRRGDRLTVNDLNNSLKWLGAQTLRGHKSREPPRLHFLKEVHLFVPNEGVVDAPTLALADSNLSTHFGRSLTGRLFTLNGDSDKKPATVENDELRSDCSQMLQNCVACPLVALNKHLVALRRTCGLHQRCAFLLLDEALKMAQRVPANPRVWHCLDHLITHAICAKSMEGLDLVFQLSKILTDSIFNLDLDAASDSELDSVRFRLLATLSRKYDFLSSSMLEFKIIGQLESSLSERKLSRILDALYWTMDVPFLFSNIDVIISQFDRHLRSGSTCVALHFSWKRLIVSILQHVLRQFSKAPPSVNFVLRTLLGLALNAFGDGFTVPLISSQGATTVQRAWHASPIGSKSGAQLLEEHWDSITTKPNGKLDNVGDVASSRKRKRRLEPLDIFDVSKRFCTTPPRRRLIFSLHGARVESASSGHSTDPAITRKASIDQKMNLLWAKMAMRRTFRIRNHQRIFQLDLGNLLF